MLAAVVSGFSIFINSYGVKGFDSSVFTFSKNVVVALFLFTILMAWRKTPELQTLSKKHWLQLAGIGLVGGSVPFLLFFKGLQMTVGQTSAFIHKTIFIYVAVFALIFLKEKPTKGLFVGAVLLLAGNYVMLRPDFGFSTGHLLIFGATILWAVENTLAKYVLRDVSGTIVAFGRMFFGCLFILVFLIATGKAGSVASMSKAQYLWILVTAALLLAYVLAYYNGLKHIKVTTAACILTLGSPITTALSFAAGKQIPFLQVVGIAFILSGVAAVVLSSQRVTLKQLSGQNQCPVRHHGRD